MTGQGHATAHGDLGTIGVELRTVNNRGFKCVPRLSESLLALENKIESLTRSMIHRGTVQLSVTWRKPAQENLPQIDTTVLQAYVDQLDTVRSATGEVSIQIDLAALVQLPGVIIAPPDADRDNESLWEFVRAAVVQAIENLNRMRSVEGRRMAESLRRDCQRIEEYLGQIKELAPRSSETYRNRLETKVKRILKNNDLEVATVDLLREVQVYADRVDISEEVTRLDSHLAMFRDVLGGGQSGRRDPSEAVPTGRKLDFVIQEMVRETNTIGSKAADAEISSLVVEVKCAIERMRELVQNLE